MLRIRSLGTVPYHEAYALQHALASEADDDYLLVLQHPHTYTLGAHADERHVLVDPALGRRRARADRPRRRRHLPRPGPAGGLPGRLGARRPVGGARRTCTGWSSW